MTVKLPLAVRKNVRDVFESKLPDFQTRIEKALGVPSYTLQMDTASLYPYALSKNMVDKIGEIAVTYFDSTISAVEVLTSNGTDTVVVDAFKKLTGQNCMALQASSDVVFSGVKFKEGVLIILYNPDWLWMGAKAVGENLHQAMDIGLLELGELPLSTQRSISHELEPAIAQFEQTFKELFKKNYTAEYDVPSTFAVLKVAHPPSNKLEIWIGKWPRYVPFSIGQYFVSLARQLKKNNFGDDKILQGAFNDKVTSGIVRFEIVEAFPDKTQNHAFVINDGVAVIQTTAELFGNGIGSIGQDVEQLL